MITPIQYAEKDVAEVAERLTAREKAEVERLGSVWDIAGRVHLPNLAEYNSVGAGKRKGVVAASLTNLGLAVRAHLLSHTSPDGDGT